MKMKKPNGRGSAASKTGGVKSPLIAIGSAGTALCLGEPPKGFPMDGTPSKAQFRSFRGSSISPQEIGALHGEGSPCGMSEYDAALFVSPRGETVRVMPLAAALAEGAVAEHRVLLRDAKGEREVVVYSLPDWSPGQRATKFMASPDVPARRIESRLVLPDRRNESYCGSILPLTFKGRKPATPAPAVKGAAKNTSKTKGAK